MTKPKLIAMAAVFAAAAWTQAPDAHGVSVELGGAPLLHRTPLSYPREALDKRIEGEVVVQVRLNANGEVVDASIVSGPDELRRGVLQGVLGWHFSRQVASSSREFTVTFHAPPRETSAAPQAQISMSTTQLQQPVRRVSSVAITGIGDDARTQLEAQLPVHAGDAMTPELRSRIIETLQRFDSHLGMAMMADGSDQFTIRIAPGITDTPSRIRVGGNVQQAKLVRQPHPVYPPDAKAAGIQGTVSMEATIGFDGHIQSLKVIKGPPELVQSAMDAVKQWVYSTTLLNGNPVEVVTQIDVNYTLTQ